MRDLKQHLRIDVSDDDQYLESLIVAARRVAEDFARRAFMQRSMRLELSEFPLETGARSDHIKLPFPPLQSITSFEYLDTAGTFTTWSSSNYITDTTAEPGRVYRAYGVSWPSIRPQHNAVRITYVCGSATGASAVPENYKHAMRMICERFYDDRGDYVVGPGITAVNLPQTAIDLLRPTRDWRMA